MLRNRTLIALLALVAVPFVAAAAQGNSETCNPEQARTVARMRAAGQAVPAGLAKKCPPPAPANNPPPVQQPPTGANEVHGYVYSDDDGNGSRDMFAGEMGLGGWALELSWNGRVIASTTTDESGNFVFAGLGNASYTVCVVPQSGFARTQPGSNCYAVPEFTSTFPTWYDVAFFGMTPQ